MTQRGRASGKSTAGRSSTGRSGTDRSATGRAAGGARGGDRARGDLGARRVRLRAVIEPVVTEAGYDLEDLSVSRAGRRHVVRVIVDGDGGVSLDAVAEVSRTVSKALDLAEETEGDLLAGEYQLEVSSPGVDRPLTLPRHWRRNVGRLVKVTAKGAGGLPAQRGAEPAPGARSTDDGPLADRQVTGRVVEADDERVVFDLDGDRTAWSYPQLGPGRVQVEFARLDDVSDEDLAGDDPADDGLTDDGDYEDDDPAEDDPADFDDMDDDDVEDEER